MSMRNSVERLELRSMLSLSIGTPDNTIGTPEQATGCGCDSCTGKSVSQVALPWAEKAAFRERQIHFRLRDAVVEPLPLASSRGTSRALFQPLFSIPTRPSGKAMTLARAAALTLASEVGPTAGVEPIEIARASRLTPFSIDLPALRKTLAGAPVEFTPAARTNPLVLTFPAPGGIYERFSVVRSDVMEPGLMAKFPSIRTYAGQSIDDPTRIIRFDVSNQGLRAMAYGGETGAYYIDPLYLGDNTSFAAYRRTDVMGNESALGWTCGVVTPDSESGEDNTENDTDAGTGGGFSTFGTQLSGSQLRTYRTAVAVSAEYTAFHGGAANALANVVTSVNRVSGLYERDMAIRLVLVANNNLLIYTNASTDPYTNAVGAGQLSVNDSNIDTVIGSANYDIGHLFVTGANSGIASLGSVGSSGKGQGMSGRNTPLGDAFDIDYVAHEMGHQFAGNHTYSNCNGSGSGTTVDVEPGSGTTIMAYAGICGATNLQANSDYLFSTVSVSEIISFVTSSSARGGNTVVGNGNFIPDVDAGIDRTIPANTPFSLTAIGTDANGDALTYSWEQTDQASGAPAVNNQAATSGPLMRSFAPVSSPTRTFPNVTSLLNNTTVIGENLPAVGRTLNFRATVRDNRSGGGGYGFDPVVVTVVSNPSGSTGFQVTSPNTSGITWAAGSSQTITWDTAGTQTNAAMGATNVAITLSTDGGNTFPITLLASTANDGSETITVPSGSGSTSARIRVQPTGNIFFDISNFNLTITNFGPPSAPTLDAASDTGVAGDNLTNRNNASPASSLTFTVPGTASGATVRVYAGASIVGTAIASGTSTTVTTSGALALADGTVQFSADQVLSGNTSTRSPNTAVVIDTVAPTLAGTPSINPGTSFATIRSQVREVAFNFSEPVSASLANFTLTNLDTASAVSLGTRLVTTAGSTATLALDRLGFDAVPQLFLADANYELRLLPTLTDLAGNPVNADASGPSGETAVFTFYKLLSDFTGDRRVNLGDVLRFNTQLGIAPAATDVAFDINNNGTINSFDYDFIRTRLNRTLPTRVDGLTFI
jgi:hypothetical protein